MFLSATGGWGNANEAVKKSMTTVTENLGSRMDGFDIWTLPDRYRRAMALCQVMGVRYIWIDSLCIIQVRSLSVVGSLFPASDFVLF